MSKGDWEVDDRRPEDENTEPQRTPCEEYGHSFETVTEDDGITPVVMGGGILKRCNDCQETYEDDGE